MENELSAMENTRIAWQSFLVAFDPPLEMRRELRSLVRSVMMDCRNQMQNGFSDIELELTNTEPFKREWHGGTE